MKPVCGNCRPESVTASEAPNAVQLGTEGFLNFSVVCVIHEEADVVRRSPVIFHTQAGQTAFQDLTIRIDQQRDSVIENRYQFQMVSLRLVDLLEVDKKTKQDQDERKAGQPRVRDTGLFARLGAYIPGLGMDQDVARAAFSLSMDKPVPDKVFPIGGSGPNAAFVVFKLVKRQDPDMKQYPQAKERIRKMLLSRRRPAQLAAWLKQARHQADIQANQAFLADITPPGMRGRS